MSIYLYPPSMRKLVNELAKLPSVGEKSAGRLAYHLITTDEKDASDLADAIRHARSQIKFCEQCFGLTEDNRCEICGDPSRKSTEICVVEKPADVIALEKSGGFVGLYHVLHGLWSPLKGIGPEKTKIGELLQRIDEAESSGTPVQEVVLATGTTVEGDATALYIANILSERGIRVSRIAQGIPQGGELEYADEMTLTHALEGRRAL